MDSAAPLYRYRPSQGIAIRMLRPGLCCLLTAMALCSFGVPASPVLGQDRNDAQPTAEETAREAPWGGTWQTSFGELRLQQRSSRVRGDYPSGQGVIEGTYDAETQTLKGSFQNRSVDRTGYFEFRLTQPGRFEGVWGWDQQNPRRPWKGRQTSAKRPELTIAEPLPGATQPDGPDGEATDGVEPGVPMVGPFTGTWQTTFGELRMHQKNRLVHGDYPAGKGSLEGAYDPETRTLKGTFRNNKMNREGLFRFKLVAEDRFEGSWGWEGQEQLSSQWNGERQPDGLPSLTIAQPLLRKRPGRLEPERQGQPDVDRPTISGPVAEQIDRQQFVIEAIPDRGRLKLEEPTIEPKPKLRIVPGAQEDPDQGQPQPPLTPQPIDGSKVDIRLGDGLGTRAQPMGQPEYVGTTSAGYGCTAQRYEVSASYDVNYLLAGQDAYIYPGALLNGSDLADGRVQPLLGQRKPYTISASIGKSGHKGSATIQDPSLSSVRSAMRGILPTDAGTPANLVFESQSISSSEDLRVFTRASSTGGVSALKLGRFGLSGSVGSDGGTEQTFRNNRQLVAVKLAQVYYTVDFDEPNRATRSTYFADQTPLPADSLLVSQVGFGRMLLILAETEYSAQELESALTITYNYSADKAALRAEQQGQNEVGLDHKKVLERTRFHVYALGGGAQQAAGVAADGIEGLKPYLKKGATFNRQNPGSVIFYKLRFANGFTPANVAFSTKVTRVDCVHTQGRVAVTFERIHADEVDDGTETNLGRIFRRQGGKDTKAEVYGIGWIEAKVERPNGKTVRLKPRNTRYSHPSQGRVVEIDPDDAFSLEQGDSAVIPGIPANGVIFRFDAREHGYERFEEMAKNAWVRAVFEIKEHDKATKNDVVGKESSGWVRLSDIGSGLGDPGLRTLNFSSDDGKFRVTYRLKALPD